MTSSIYSRYIPHNRKGWPLVVLQAFFDDSADNDPKTKHPRMLIYAGYVATEEQWASFASEWESALKDTPAINYFKMSEAIAGRGQFADIDKIFREIKIKLN